ncbi:concanavalin A-like lectin/glucanase domain-containing protein [Gigaspora rosea]|uniref:Concanavalin A-like lectin/glucanase domain-containing protein n=1 Tax=Gigaspora rosea TaxID=44941 RepID=A0A397VPW9_9GLOM|nr:concanavalin A-like lectin/glucanase domain-containing protein [Gigaspora rosea]
MDNLELMTPYNDIVLPTAWDIEEKSPFINIDSSGLKVDYTGSDDYEAAIVQANNPIPSQCAIFYFEIKIINKEKNGMIGVGYCTKQCDKKKGDSVYINKMLMPGQGNESWGCGYHGDDGYSFCSGSGEPYGSKYTTGDIIGCYINFTSKLVFYTKNGINLGIACYLHTDSKGILYPCIGFKSHGRSIEANFGNEKFKYSAMNNEDICNKFENSLEWEYQKNVCFYENMLVNLTNELTQSLEKEQSNVFELSYRGKIFFIIAKYKESLKDFSRVLEIEPDNTIALRYRGEINYLMINQLMT